MDDYTHPDPTRAPRPLNAEELGGEAPCFAHLLDDDGRLTTSSDTPGETPTPAGPDELRE